MKAPERASIFGNSTSQGEGASFALDRFKPKAPAAAPSPEAIAAISSDAGYPSRQPVQAAETKRPATTGRNVQFNLKAAPETLERFRAITAQKRWSLAQAFEFAVAALEKDLNKDS